MKIREITHLSEITSVCLTGGLSSGDLVGSSGSSSSLEGNTDSGTSDLELVVFFCVLTISISCPSGSMHPVILHLRESAHCYPGLMYPCILPIPAHPCVY